MSLSERMVQYRAQEDISQAELAERCGVSTQTINTVERGLQTPSRVTAAKIELIVGKEQEDGSIDHKD